MARTLKTTGLEELRALKRRVNRQYAMGRIRRSDRDFLITSIDVIEARITTMHEQNENGEEEAW